MATENDSTKFQHKFETEQEARAHAVLHYGQTKVQIIQSQGAFYLEDAASDALLRTWEREVFIGLGRKAAQKEPVAR